MSPEYNYMNEYYICYNINHSNYIIQILRAKANRQITLKILPQELIKFHSFLTFKSHEEHSCSWVPIHMGYAATHNRS